ncbi:MAG: threonine--tRNA ligase [Candidatus Buchananbacteria bacterium RBG_13_36_9]|uniref:Threonine--tRNA ligase n=1 Tax=Candidatus Buchananbacteria bacterium RBG_13_36_9 TaxID=1797530 RepID=A0A1G1XQI6_9BACT|nr:MAG: threonine--tRNA ligase [Candidatus Buchananbacteria bacterium RBG_13_36_9]
MTKENQNSKLDIMRHSVSHVMAAAVKELYKDVKFAIGPTIAEGFYYDFDLGKNTLSEEDLLKIEEKMKQIIRQNLKFEREEAPIKKALEKVEGQPYKIELIKDLEKEGEKKVSFYKLGDIFEDLCKGPHIKSTKEIGAFKLLRVSGAYWRGDEKNKMLQRIYGTAFTTQKELDEYLNMLEEAEKRDHRKIGKEQELFLIDQSVGMGLPMWFPKGALIWRIMEDFWYQEHLKNGYELVRSPHIGSRSLWEQSGHWGFYNESMYPPLEIGQALSESQEGKKAKVKEEFLLKPMNCPFHVVLYKSRPRSYRELPLRWAECGTVYRYEKSGELSGLTRVRGFTQDDAHIICTSDQVESELKRVVDFILFIYKSFGFEIESINVYLSVRDPESKKYAGNDEGWDFTEKVLEKVAKEKKLNISKDVGGAVFYGPKLDFKVKDAIGREWQCSTLQFDFNLPERFAMRFINDKGKEEQPYMLHRALFGSFERFIGVLIEHYAGAWPVWLSPVQVKIINIGAAHEKYCQEVADKLRAEGIRVELDLVNETVGNKIRKGEKDKIPYILVAGDKEIASGQVAVRQRGKGDLGPQDLEKFIQQVKEEILNHK